MPKVISTRTKPADAAMSGSGLLVWARRPFDYDDSLPLDRGQYFRLRNYRNDEKLLRLGLVEEVKSDVDALICAECGSAFIDELCRIGHAKKQHPNFRRKRTPQEEDVEMDREEKQLSEVAPLYIDKTKASQKG